MQVDDSKSRLLLRANSLQERGLFIFVCLPVEIDRLSSLVQVDGWRAVAPGDGSGTLKDRSFLLLDHLLFDPHA